MTLQPGHGVEHLLKQEALLNKISPLLASPKTRNQLFRHAAQVEYRCSRGCILGAVFRVDGQDYLWTRRNVSMNVGTIDIAEDGEPIGLENQPRLRREVSEQVERALETSSNRPDDIQIATRSIKEAYALPAEIPGGLEGGLALWWGAKGGADPVNPMNCFHVEWKGQAQQIAEDIEALRGRPKKVIYLPRRNGK